MSAVGQSAAMTSDVPARCCSAIWPITSDPKACGLSPKAAGRNQLSCHLYHCGECSEIRGSNPDYGAHHVRGGRMHAGEWAHD